MIKVTKQLFILLSILIILIVTTFCITAIVNHNTEQLVSNSILAITSIVGLFVKYDEHHPDDSDNDSE
jgi:ABC-type multidrug transport system permease subunit